ncbi:hypothetical protein ANI_1_3182014 [Paecilomyces variotii No. 5]|uniref:GAT domain-containing protein n=1 Tax=Byssochlamys spectabilis (strain No. 5 / NBRC 109023) TaxID=1356009 RepID=V5FTS6_BYSSN|nr:hypothetical protein ANI_1_3182014 [Paecilomyces variotii No. 5]
MKRFLGSLNRRESRERSPVYPDDSPEATVLREVKLFCETGSGPDRTGQTDEYLHLPAIVEAAESSPNAAREAAIKIRKYLSKPTSPPSSVHYNAIMLIRILADNPGHTFTRNIDAKFVSVIKDMLRLGKGLDVQHILRETLDSFETERAADPDLEALLEMWSKEKEKFNKSLGKSPVQHAPANPQQQHPVRFPRHERPRTLPPPEELASRIAEARNSAKLLQQFVQSTPPTEMIGNELIKEFAERCQTAVRSIQGYISADNPAPDEDTLVTLIESNDELSVALSTYQRGILKARKAMGANTPREQSVAGSSSSDASRPVPPPPVPPRQNGTTSVATAETLEQPAVPAAAGAADIPNRYEYNADDFQVQNPFADSNTHELPTANGSQSGRANESATTNADSPGVHNQPLTSNPV